MVDLEQLKKAGYSPDKLQSKFESENPDEKTKRLKNLNSGRIKEGINYSLDQARLWWAIDQAYDAPHKQITYTLVRGLLDSNPSSNETVLAAAQNWGLTNMLTTLHNSDGTIKLDRSGTPQKRLDLPTFFNIFVPVVMSYVKIRWGKLFDDRDLYPLYKYEPSKVTVKNKMKTQIVTDRIQRMSEQMGYRSDERQSLLQTLLYGFCINFPREPWWKEEQILDGKEQIIREGVRFEIPHPSRVFWDRAHQLSSINTDTGIEYMGYWSLMRFREVMETRKYWNKDKITYSNDNYPWHNSTSFRIYQELYPCVAKFPQFGTTGGAVGDTDRESKAFEYTQEKDDYAVSVIPIFHKLVPKEWGLFDYDKPIWMRFIYSNEVTVIHAMPFCYTPAVAYMYDYDQNRFQNSSLGLELVPWQDMLGNYLTQYLLSVKQNLANLVFYNTDLVDEDLVKKIQNMGEKFFRSVNFEPFSGKEAGWVGQDIRRAFENFQMAKHDINGLAGAVQMLISVMERMLGFSAQEMGGAATHQQSATELSIVAANTGVRMNFTGGFVDDARSARKRLLYDAMLAHSSDEIFAQVAALNDMDRKALSDIGFEVEEESDGETRAGVKGKKADLLMLDGFASDREGTKRIVDQKLAELMIQMFQSIFSNPVLIEKAGIDQIIKMLNEILLFAGVPSDFKIEVKEGEDVATQQQQVLEQIAPAIQQLVGQQVSTLGQEIGQAIQGIQSQHEQIGGALQQLSEGQQATAQELEMVKQQVAQAIENIVTAVDQTAGVVAQNGGAMLP